MLRFGQISGDEYFVNEAAANKGVVITNRSNFEPMVILKNSDRIIRIWQRKLNRRIKNGD